MVWSVHPPPAACLRAESYILKHVKDLPTAHKFMGIINGFKERLAWHGQVRTRG
jgi:hypothetical protein